MAEVYDNPIGNVVAMARVSAVGALVGPAIGIASVALLANVFTVTMSNAIDVSDAAIECSVNEATSAVVTVLQTSDTTIEVRGFSDAGAALDVAFALAVFRKAVG